MATTTSEPCVCSQLRRTARMISMFYDGMLATTGLTVTQYALLASISRIDGLSRTVLAAQLGMDRSTLTRNVAPLERAGLIVSKPGQDRREHQLHLTPAGHKQAATARPKWAQAQQRMLAHLGKKQWDKLRKLLLLSEEILQDA